VRIDVAFSENSQEYIGTMLIDGATSVNFNPDHPRRIMIDSLTIDIDEEITRVAVNGNERSISEGFSELELRPINA
jgi:hypothetical protein